MKSLITLLLFCLSHFAWGDAYLGCGASSWQQRALARDFLAQNHEHFLLTHCQVRNEPAIEDSGFFLALPQFSWQESVPASLSHREQSQLLQSHLSWPFWRANEFIFSVELGYERFTAELPLKENMHWQTLGNLVFAQQEIDFKQQDSLVGIKTQLAYTESPINFVSVSRHSARLPVAINEGSRLWLNRIDTQSWQFRLGRDTQGIGLLWLWNLSAEAGEISSLAHPLPTALNTDQFLGMDLSLALGWRWRINNRVHPYVKAQASSRYWFFDEGKSTQTALGALWQYAYAVEAGMEWRF